MPIKSIREMTKAERRRNSLRAKTIRLTIGSAIFLGIIALAVGIAVYVLNTINHYIDDAVSLTKNVATVMAYAVDAEPFTTEVMSVYKHLPASVREQVGTDEYYRHFNYISKKNGYSSIMHLLTSFRENSEVDDIYLAMYDRDTLALVYIADPDPDSRTACPIGYWEPAVEREVEAFLNASNTDRLYFVENHPKYGWICTSGVPIIGRNGHVKGFILADITLDGLINELQAFIARFTLAIASVTLLLALMISRRLNRTLVTPIKRITEAASTYTQDKKNGISKSDHFSRLSIQTGDEIENLSLVMSDMERDLTDYEEDLTKAVTEKERILTELSLATRIQADMLPNHFPAFPDRGDFDIYASMTPAREVGGDFYDFFLIDPYHLALVIADVSGKGIPGALFMMASMIMIQNYAGTGMSPAEILEACNDQICRNNREEMFITVWLGIFDLSTGELTAANAGHEYPALMKAGSGFELIREKHGFVIGGMPGMIYKNYTITLKPGDKLFVYTDGLPESTSLSEELYGTGRMIEALNKTKDGTPQEILQYVEKDAARFVGPAPAFDDLTMLCLHYKECNPDLILKEETFEAVVENIPVVTSFITDELENIGCPDKARIQLSVAVDEIFSNIAFYAYKNGAGKATVRFETEIDPKAVVLTFIDSGVPYDPTKAAEPDVSLPIEKRKIGGLGVFLVKKTMDEMTYVYDNGQNILKIKKLI